MQLLARHHVHLQHPNLISFIFLTSIDKSHLVTALDAAVDNLEVGNDAAERIEHRIKDQRLQRCRLITDWTGNTIDNSIEDVIYALTCFATGANNFLTLAAKEVDDFILHFFRHRIRHVAFVHHWNNLQIVINGHIKVRNRLCLHTLGSIHH